MIHSFSAENFYSIGERIEVNLVSKEKKPNLVEMYLDAPFGDKVAKMTFVGGSNASGKTNVLRILSYLKYMIVDSAMPEMRHDGSLAFSQFVPYGGSKTTKLSVDFSINDEEYYYTLELTPNRILNETLRRKRIVTERATIADVFSREWDKKTGHYIISVSDELKTIKSLTTIHELIDSRQEYSFIAILSNFDENDGIIKRVANYWSGVISNIQMFGSAETNNSMAFLSSSSLKTIYENKELYNAVSDILKKYDIGFSGINKKEKQGPNKDQTIYMMEHQYGETSFDLSMNLESSGTQRMIVLLETAILALSRKEGIAVVDELDAFLHPNIFEEIVELFMSHVTNPNNAQLIFSAQNYSMLSRLDKQQITLTEKDKTCGQTEVWRLDDIEGINSRDDFYKKYLTGAYGGVPEIG